MVKITTIPSDIQKILLAGAFGSHIHPISACRIRLLPEVLQGRIDIAGSVVGVGAKCLLVTKTSSY